MLNMMSNENVGSPLAKNRNSGYIEPSAETKNSRPAMMSDFLRPRLVASRPEKAEPMMQPMRADAEVKPCHPSV